VQGNISARRDFRVQKRQIGLLNTSVQGFILTNGTFIIESKLINTMKTTIINWPSISEVKVKMLDGGMINPPCVIYKRIRNIEEFKALPDVIIEYGLEFRKRTDYVYKLRYPYTMCIRTRSRCTACSCAETVCKYKRTSVTCAIYTR
jgi:hypothetical protein